MASIAVLPVLIGLAVDYAIQFQARWDEQRDRGQPPEQAAAAAAAAGGPTIAAAGLATAAGFLVLLLSPVPMVRSFGAMLVVGIILAFACVLTAGFVLLVRYANPRERPDDVPPVLPRVRARAARVGGRSRRSAPARWLASARRGDAALVAARVRVLACAPQAASSGSPPRSPSLGLVATFFHDVESDVRELVPQDLQALKDANELQEATGVSGEIDVTVTGRDLTDPQVIAWMTRFQDKVLADHGYREGARSCRVPKDPPELCPAVSLPDLFRSGTPQDAASVKALLDAVPRYFSQAAISVRPAHRQPGVRHPPDAARAPAAGDRRHRARDRRPVAEAPGRRRRPGRRPAGAGRRGERQARVAVVALR